MNEGTYLDVLEVPLIALPNQQLNVTLDGQNCTIAVYQRDESLYLDLYVGQTCIRTGAICIPTAPIITGSTAFKGQLYIVDTLSQPDAQSNPVYTGLGDKFKLIYLTQEQEESIQDAKYKLYTAQNASASHA